jgi:hypothetical protein
LVSKNGQELKCKVLLRREQRKKCPKSCTAKAAILLQFIPINYDLLLSLIIIFPVAKEK